MFNYIYDQLTHETFNSNYFWFINKNHEKSLSKK